jgi:hypothetical protein
LQPRLQKGAYSEASGLRQRGQDLVLSGCFGIPAGNGKQGIGAQADYAAHLPGKSSNPVGPLLDHCDDSWMSDKLPGSCPFQRRAANERACFEW